MTSRAKHTHRVGMVERTLNLVAFLLRQDEPVPWFVIQSQVGGYDDEGAVEAPHRRAPLRDGSGRAAEETALYRAAKRSTAALRRFERDKELLKSLGIPIEYVPHNSADPGGYFIRRESFFLPPARLTSKERMILACLHTTAALDGSSPVLGALLSALQKLRFDEAPHENRPPDSRLPVFKLDAVARADVQDNLAVLIDAAKQHKRVTFFYHSMHRDAVEERTVEPYGVFLREGKWYLVGRCAVRQATRMFRLDRIMTQVEVNRQNPGRRDFQRPRNFRLKKYLNALAWETGPGPDAKKLYDAKIVFSKEVWWMAREAVAGARFRMRAKDGSAVVTMPVYREEPLVRWLLKYGANVVVISPERLRNLIINTVKDIRKRHA